MSIYIALLRGINVGGCNGGEDNNALTPHAGPWYNVARPVI